MPERSEGHPHGIRVDDQTKSSSGGEKAIKEALAIKEELREMFPRRLIEEANRETDEGVKFQKKAEIIKSFFGKLSEWNVRQLVAEIRCRSSLDQAVEFAAQELLEWSDFRLRQCREGVTSVVSIGLIVKFWRL